MKSHLGHYEIVSELGRGGMGVVYKGYEPSLARYVAIKELSPALAGDAAVVERFLREARSMALLNDPHIIQIYSIGQENELPFFVMEFVDGTSVAALIQRDHRLQPPDALKIVHQTAQGLSAAHDRGVIHRDIKPANLMVSLRGKVKIADFGIALANADMNAKLTSAGEMVGTPGYLPPELLLGHPVDQRSDVYALGVALFEMLTGRTPFSDASVYKLMLDVVQTEVPDVREINAEIDPGVAAILAKMLIKDPAKRYQSMHELIADLEKHPLVARGGPLTVNLSAGSSADTAVSLARPMTPASVLRSPTAPPVMSRQSAAMTPTHLTRGGVTPVVAATAASAMPTPAPEQAMPAVAASAAAPPRRSYWPFAVFLAAVAISIGAWVFRAQVMALMAPYLSDRGQLLGWWTTMQGAGVEQLRPLLKRIGIHMAPELVFNLLVALVVLLVIRSISFRISRARARRAYSRGARRTI